MINERCENCKYSSWLGSLIWSGRKLICDKGYNTLGVDYDRYFYKRGCKDYIIDIDKMKSEICKNER